MTVCGERFLILSPALPELFYAGSSALLGMTVEMNLLRDKKLFL